MSAHQSSSSIRVAVVEDEPDARELFRRVIIKSAGHICVGAFITGEEALANLLVLPPDVVLMDIHLPGMSGIECMQSLRQKHPRVKVIMVTSDHSDECLFEALRAGADGYVTKPCDRPTLIRVIAETMAGRHPIASDMTMHLMQAAMNKPKSQWAAHPDLSPRENEVLRWLAQGMENKAIASRLGISVFTVNAHLQAIYGKLRVTNRVEALRVVTGL